MSIMATKEVLNFQSMILFMDLLQLKVHVQLIMVDAVTSVCPVSPPHLVTTAPVQMDLLLRVTLVVFVSLTQYHWIVLSCFMELQQDEVCIYLQLVGN